MTIDGLLIVDKPSGCTSHDVVATLRRLIGTRRVGHAGTLDPMATGVLLLGMGRATRLLGHLALTDKEYSATIRLGQSTVTDDAEGEVTGGSPAGALTDAQIEACVASFRGQLSQVPSAVSAVKVAGRRAHARVRAGEDVRLPPRSVRVHSMDIVAIDRAGVSGGTIDVDVTVACSTGTYIRALARDIGAQTGVGGHVTHLRRTRVGSYRESAAFPLTALTDNSAIREAIHPLAVAVAESFPRRNITAQDALLLQHGSRLSASGHGATPLGVFDPDGEVVALTIDVGEDSRSLVVFRGETDPR
jgi:tRNA pseudouridine55 synthase